MGFRSRLFSYKNTNLLLVIEEFLNASNASDARRILKQHPELLSEETDLMLDTLSKDINRKEIINTVRNFLTRCQEVGITLAFEEIEGSSDETSKEDLHILLKEIDSLSSSQDMPRKIMMLQHAVSLIKRQTNPELWAALNMMLGCNLYQNSQGNRGDSIEEAISHLNQALEVYNQKDFPKGWAKTQNNLGVIYLYRIIGNETENVEKAIEHLYKALKVRTQKDFPEDWAQTQYNLGLANLSRILGDRAENIEKAIKRFNGALEVYNQKDFPKDWAQTKNDLGLAYYDRIRGDRAKNIEKAIEYYNHALKVYTYDDFPVDWAQTQNNLANAYTKRIIGDRTGNIDSAIEQYNKTLEVYTQKDFPKDWAMIQNNLGLAYSMRISGDIAENIEKAIKQYEKALEIYTQNDFAVNWADTLNNLGSAYINRIEGDEGNNIEKSIEHLNYALKVRTYQDFPVEWALTQNNLASAYYDRIRGDRAENIEQAIDYYKQGLKVLTQNGFSEELVRTQHNLAGAYLDRILGDRAENIEKATSYYHNALKTCKLESMPSDFRNTCRLLGDLYFSVDRWEDSLKSFKDALKACDLIYKYSLSAQSKAIEANENAQISQNTCLAASRLGMVNESLFFLENGKTRLLNEALQLKMKQPVDVPNEEWIKYEQAVEKYRTATKLSNQEDYTQRGKEAHKALVELNAAAKVIQEYNPEFQKELDISDILSIPDAETALLAFCITDKGSIGFVVSGSKGIECVNIPDFKTEDLNSLLFKTDKQGYIKGGWVGDYRRYLFALETYHYFRSKHEENQTSDTEMALFASYKRYESIFEEWKISLNELLDSIGSRILSPLLAVLPSRTKKLILLPSGGLSLLPLHAVPLSDDQLLCQRYCISYAPSIPLLKEMKNKAVTVGGKGLYEVINPEKDPTLVFSECEGHFISKFFQNPKICGPEQGTKPTVLYNIPGKAYIHFSCHGSYNWIDPHHSGLRLFGGRSIDTLSLEDLQNDEVDMSSARLVTLSACETGITDNVRNRADEFVGLPAGFMLAGVPCVVSSLWSVPDISTAILMERFYSNHIVEGTDIPLALQDAQLWVRNLTSRQVADYVEKCYRSGKWEGKSKELIEQYREYYLRKAKESPEEKLFRDPYYWAAFTVNGA